MLGAQLLNAVLVVAVAVDRRFRQRLVPAAAIRDEGADARDDRDSEADNCRRWKRRDDLRTDVEKAISRRAPNADAAVVAAFVSQQTKDADAADNRARHVHVIEALAHRPALQEEATTRALCRLAREAADTGDVAKGKLYLEALNTLEACRRFGGALSLFERVCSPADDVSKELRRLYCKGAFGELRLKRFVFERVGEDPQMAAALDRHEREVLAKVLPPPPPPPRPPSGTRWLWWLCAGAGIAAASSRVFAPRAAAPPPPDLQADAAEEEAELLRQIAEDEKRVDEARRRLESIRKRGR